MIKFLQVLGLGFMVSLGGCAIIDAPNPAVSQASVCGPEGGLYPPSEPAAYLLQPREGIPLQFSLLIEASTGRAHLYAWDGQGWSPNLCLQLERRRVGTLTQAAIVGLVTRVGPGNNPWLEVRSQVSGWEHFRIGSITDPHPRTAFGLSGQSLQILGRRLQGWRQGAVRPREIGVIILERFGPPTR